MPSYDAYMASLSPLGWWKLSDAVGAGTAVDSSGNGHSATVNGTVVFGQSGPVAGDTAALFSGASSSYLYCSTNPLTAVATFSILGWYYMNTGVHGCVLKVGNNTTGYGIGVGGNSRFENVGTDNLGLYEQVAWLDTGTSTGTGWHMIALTASASSPPLTTIYVDGVAVFTTSSDTPIAPSSDLYIGGYTSSTGTLRYWNSSVAQLAIFGETLTATQISNLYDYARAPSAPAPQVHCQAVNRASRYFMAPDKGWRRRESGLLWRG